MILVLTSLAFANPTLTLQTQGLTTSSGQVLCTLYDSADTWLQDPGYLAVDAATPNGSTATCVFEAVPPGTYAISFIHDENDNGDMDNNFLGMPTEPWGMSQDPRVVLSAPSFASASFEHPAPAPLTATAR